MSSRPSPVAVERRARGDSFAMIRSGILDHLLAGKLGLPELGIYTVIHLQANFSTGVWWGSAPRIRSAAPRGASLRDVQRSLERLVQIRFIRPFHVHGQRGNYPWLIHKYRVRLGALRGHQLNAWASTCWERPAYEVCAESYAEPVSETAPIQYSVVQESGGREASNHRFSSGEPTIAFPAATLESKAQTAKQILVEKGHPPDVVEIALLRVANLAEAKGKNPQSVAYFVKSVESNLDDEGEFAACRKIAADRRSSGVPLGAPLQVNEWHAAAKIAFVHSAVEEGARSGRRASTVAAERLAAAGGAR